MKLVDCYKSFDEKHIFSPGELYRETYPFFGFTFLARRKIIKRVLRCQACGMTVDPTPANMKKLKKYFKRK